MIKGKGYVVPDGYVGYANGRYQLCETEKAYYEYLLVEVEL
mgnify:CR=1 FL=1